MSYILRNVETGRYVAEPEARSSYTNAIQNARQYPTIRQADLDRCVGNEEICYLDVTAPGFTRVVKGCER